MASERPATTGSTVLDKAVRLLKAFDASEPSLSLGQLAKRAGMPSSTAHRVAQVLVANDLLATDGQGTYSLGLWLVELGDQVLRSRHLLAIVQPFIEQLVRDCQESCHVALLDRGDSVYVARVPGPHVLTVQSHMGQRVPAYCTATGKALLAFQPEQVLNEILAGTLKSYTPSTKTARAEIDQELAEIRGRGYSLNFGEWQSETVGTAAPVFGPGGATVAAIGLAGPAYRVPEARLQEFGELVREVSRTVSRQLGFIEH